MELDEKKRWRIFAIAGMIFLILTCIISVLQYFDSKQYVEFIPGRYDSMVINFFALFCFIYMIFNPLHLKTYALVLYVYGLGNFLDRGILLGFLCLLGSLAFFFDTGFFKSRKVLKLILLYLPALVLMVINIKPYGIVNFLVNIFHILGVGIITIMILLLYYPRIQELQQHKKVKYISRDNCSEQDLEWLALVLNGDKYITIARQYKVSESKVKTRMLELYKLLNAKDRTEFLTMYHNSTIQFLSTETEEAES